jgi:C_GCAxxG_C_C family probable redox protein
MPAAAPNLRDRRASRALKNFRQGFNCAQAVLSAYSTALHLDLKTGHRVSQAFGGGLCRQGMTCGAVTGGLMVIGLKHGKTRAKDNAARDKTYALGREFMRRFQARHGSLSCRQLLGHDIGTRRGAKLIQEQNLHRRLCDQYVRDAVRILSQLTRR